MKKLSFASIISKKVKFSDIKSENHYFLIRKLFISNYSFADYNFDTFGDAAVTVFAVLANEDWSKIYFNHARVNGLGKSSVFFISLVIIGQMILLKLFLTIQLK